MMPRLGRSTAKILKVNKAGEYTLPKLMSKSPTMLTTGTGTGNVVFALLPPPSKVFAEQPGVLDGRGHGLYFEGLNLSVGIVELHVVTNLLNFEFIVYWPQARNALCDFYLDEQRRGFEGLTSEDRSYWSSRVQWSSMLAAHADDF